MNSQELKATEVITLEEVEKCIAVLERLVADTDQIFEIPKERRTALIKASGQFSRPSREEFSRRKKDAKKGKRKHKQKYLADQVSAFLCLLQNY